MVLSILSQTVNLFLQTQAQKSATMVGFGCVAVLLMILCMDKSSFSGKQKWLLLTFMGVFMLAFFLLYFFVVK